MMHKINAPETPEGEVVNIEGCSTTQLDTDGDGVSDNLDLCTNTATGSIVDENGCALEQKDSDGDGVNDAEDAFPDNASIDSDRDNDGVADEFDAYPDDALRSEFEEESSNSGLIHYNRCTSSNWNTSSCIGCGKKWK